MNNIASPILTIVCIVYNHEKYLKKTLEGFVNQETKYKYEILIHDDASTDKSAEIIKDYQRKYPDIIKPILQTENQVSKGVKLFTIISNKVTGKYIALCEGDDYWSNNKKIELQIDFLEKNGEYSGVTHNTAIINNEGIRIGRMCEWEKDRDITELDSMLFFPHTSSYMFRNPWDKKDEKRRKYAEYITGWDKSYAIYMVKTGKVRYFKEEYSCYRYVTQTGTSVSYMETQYNMTKKRVSIEYELYNQLIAYDMLGKNKNYYCDHYYQNIYHYSIRKMIENPSLDNLTLIIYGIKKDPYPVWVLGKYVIRKIVKKIMKSNSKVEKA